ncbi:MAG: hypothetical protein ACRBCJ_07005 [Hyphomicrobiaceae bacterium]
MKVQFREQTPGVRSGEWWDPTTDRYHSVVTIQSLDGWVGYIGDKRIDKEFASHEAAAEHAISQLESQLLRRQAYHRLAKFTAPGIAVGVLALVIHSVFFSTTEPPTEIANADTQSNIATSSIQQPTPTRPMPTAHAITNASSRASSASEYDQTTYKVTAAATHDDNQAIRREATSTDRRPNLPRIHMRHAEPRPWEKPLSEHAIAKEPEAALENSTTDATKPIARTAKLSENGRLDESQTGTPSSITTTNSDDSNDDNGETFYDLDLAADMRADQEERERFLNSEKQDVEQTETSPAHEKAPTEQIENANTQLVEDDEAPALTPIHTNTSPTPYTSQKAYKKRSVKKRKFKSKAALKRRTTKRARRKSRSPLVRRIVRRNAFGQRYVVYKARRPRNAREYRRLQRIKRRIAAKRRQYYYKNGY